MVSTVKIRKATIEDALDIARIQRASFARMLEHYLGSNAKAVRKAKLITDQLYYLLTKCMKDEIFVAEIDNEIVGNIIVPYDFKRSRRKFLVYRAFWMAIVKILYTTMVLSRDNRRIIMSDGHSVRRIEYSETKKEIRSRIFNIAVHPNFQGRGIGKALLSRGLQYLFKHCGAKAVTLNVISDNETAIKLYQSFGFKETERTSSSMGEWIIMVLKRDEWLQVGT